MLYIFLISGIGIGGGILYYLKIKLSKYDINPIYTCLYKLHKSNEYCTRFTLQEHLVFTMLKLCIYTTRWTLITDQQIFELYKLIDELYKYKYYTYNQHQYCHLDKQVVVDCINCIDRGRKYHQIRKSIQRTLLLYF